MSNEQKASKLIDLIFRKTYPKEQFGFYTEEMLLQDIMRILEE